MDDFNISIDKRVHFAFQKYLVPEPGHHPHERLKEITSHLCLANLLDEGLHLIATTAHSFAVFKLRYYSFPEMPPLVLPVLDRAIEKVAGDRIFISLVEDTNKVRFVIGEFYFDRDRINIDYPTDCLSRAMEKEKELKETDIKPVRLDYKKLQSALKLVDVVAKNSEVDRGSDAGFSLFTYGEDHPTALKFGSTLKVYIMPCRW